MRLDDPIRYTDDNNLGIATIRWQEATSVQYHSRIYNITVEPATERCNSSCVTKNQFVQLVLDADTEYNVTVVTEVCNGKLKSAKSKPLPISFKGMIQSQ